MLPNTAHPGWEVSGFSLGRRTRGKRRHDGGSPGQCLTLADPWLRQAQSPSRRGSAFSCICRAMSSGPSRSVVAYFLFGATAQASLEQGNGMFCSDVIEHAGHLSEIEHLWTSAVVTSVKCARKRACFCCTLSHHPPASCL